MKIIRIRRTVQDQSLRRTRDDRLSAVPVPKLFVMGKIWAGDLLPFLDSGLEMLAPLVSGFTTGQTLHAQSPKALLDLGRLWVGDLRQRMSDAGQTDPTKPVDTNLTEVLRSVETLQKVMAADDPSAAVIGDAIANLRRARDGVKVRVGDSAGSWGAGFLARSRDHTRAALSAMKTAAQHIAAKPVSASSVRDHVRAITSATSTAAKMTAMNLANRRFWDLKK